MSEVYKGIVAVMADLAEDGISKSRRNTQGAGYNFRGIDDVYNVLSHSLAKHQLVIIPRVQAHKQLERESKSGGALYFTTVDVEFDIVSAVDGSKHTARTIGEAMDSSDKSSNKAMSAAYKYMAFQAFCIPTEGDNDADAATPVAQPKKAATLKKDGAWEAIVSEIDKAMSAGPSLVEFDTELKGYFWKKGKELGFNQSWMEELKSVLIGARADIEAATNTVDDIKNEFPGAKVSNERYISTLEAGE